MKTSKHLIIFCLLICCQLSIAQNIWQNISEDEIVNLDGIKELFPNQAAYYDLRISDLRQILQNVPSEEDISIENSSTIIPVPFPDGEVVQFRVVSYQMLEPELAAKHPNIRNYRGIAVGNASTTVRFDWTARGFRAVLRKDGQQIFIDPYARGNQRYYMSYFKKDYPESKDFECLFNNGNDIHDKKNESAKSAGDCQFRSYRLAVTTTAEYSNFFGANSAAQSNLVLAEVNTAINRVNEVYERDLGVRLILIANTENVFYYNSGSDPYTNGNPNALIGQSQSTINSVIGSANYDVGHLFGTGADSGLAALRSVCSNGSKAEGVTLRINPTGDPFYIDYLAHELGHQFGGNHTQNNNCNRSSVSYEPGSASTIMGYAGICSPNVQSNSDAYFHAISVQEMSNFITGSGNSCANIISTANSAPIVTDPGDFSIPKSTPFVLSTTATDANSDPLTYCWEQWDPEVAAMPPVSTNTSGPLFRSLESTSSPERYFINLPDLAAGVDPNWEELPSVARNMEFRITVRDNNSNYGCTDEQNVDVTVTNSDPFVVQAPNTNVTLSGGQTYNVQWDEAQTAQSPISCGTVDIRLSTDGGLSFPTLLLAGTSNDGAANVTIPSVVTTTARIMVRCSEGVGIFFDISDTNFEIENSNPDYTLSANPTEETNCGGNSVTYTINVGSLAGFNDPVTLSATSLPAGASASFAPNPVTPGNASTLTVSNLNAVSDGTYNFNVEGNSTSGNKSISLVLNVVTPSPSNLLTPTDGATAVSTSPTLTWDAATSVISYDVEVATDAGFSSVVASTNVPGTSWVVSPTLNTMTTYFWRVRNVRSCGNDPWSSVFSFTTDDIVITPCLQFDGGPYTNFEPPVCYPNCQTPVTVGFEVWANEAYLLRGLTVGAEYTFEFCNGYDAADWAANITVAEWDGSNATANISTVSGCTITFTATVVDAVLIIFDTCGNPELQVDNGSPTFRCTGNGPTLPDSCPALPEGCTVSEDFTSGQPVTGWTFSVTGNAAGAAWAFDANDVGDNTPNPGAGNWATYDDDDAGNSGDNNIATATSPLVDMSNYENIELSFDYAYDQFDSETLRLFIADGTTTYYWTGSAWSTTNTVWLSSTDQSGSFQEALPIALDLASFNVTLQYDDQSNWAWGFGFDNFNLCGDLIEDNCPEMLAVDGDPMNSDIIDAGIYTAQNIITSTGTVEMGTTVTFEAGQSITLSPDFFAENGSTFTARIQACTPAVDNSVVEERNEEIVPESDEVKVYPNPFSDFTTVEVQLAEYSDLEIGLYSLTGKQLSTIAASNQMQAGTHQFVVNASNLDSGIYLLIIRIDDKIQTKKLSLIK